LIAETILFTRHRNFIDDCVLPFSHGHCQLHI
jgi:hypothetical protein